MHNIQQDSPSDATRNRRKSLGLVPLSPEILSQYPIEPTYEQAHQASTYLLRDDSLALTFLRHEREGEKTACIINNPTLPMPNFSQVIASDRPSAPVGHPTPKSGTTLFRVTPGGTRLKRSMHNGVLTTYSNIQMKRALSYSIVDEKDRPGNLLKTESNFKEQSITVTYDDLVKGHKSRCQQSVMASSGIVKAADAAKASGVYQDNDIWHWMHLIAYKLGGEKMQIPENLIAGTVEANTVHQVLELEIQNILNCKVEEVVVTGVAEHDDNHVGTNLLYRIKAPQFDLTFIIDPQTRQKPSAIDESYVHNFLEHLITSHKENIQATSCEEHSSLKQSFADREVKRTKLSEVIGI